RPWMAILVSSLLFALYQLNVFQFIPHFILGLVLGFLAVKSGSVLPSMLFHLIHNALQLGGLWLQSRVPGKEGTEAAWFLQPAVTVACLVFAVLVLWRLANLRPAGSGRSSPTHYPRKEPT